MRDIELSYQELLDALISDLRYEMADGIHTYHQCKYCDEFSTRSGKCAVCLVKEFKNQPTPERLEVDSN